MSRLFLNVKEGQTVYLEFSGPLLPEQSREGKGTVAIKYIEQKGKTARFQFSAHESVFIDFHPQYGVKLAAEA